MASYRKLIDLHQEKILAFAQKKKLPIVQIEEQWRPVLGSGLWWPFPWLQNMADDVDFWELDNSVGKGHLVPPFDRYITRAHEQLVQLIHRTSTARWIHQRHLRDQLDNVRPGELIVAADQLGVPLRYFDWMALDVEFLLDRQHILAINSTEPILSNQHTFLGAN